MQELLSYLSAQAARVDLTAALDILVVGILIYQTVMILRGRRAAPIFVGVLIIIVAYFVATYAGLELLRSILSFVVPYTAIALIVLFQSDIRRTLARLGRTRWMLLRSRYLDQEAIGEVLLALQRLSNDQTGALVVLERSIGLRTFTESGVSLNADLSVDLLISIFRTSSPLHDGAAIIQNGRIAAASCFLPLSVNPNISRMLGTRHRAAIGVSEESDALAIVVSEETGNISIASFGEIELAVSLERVEETLRKADRPHSPVRHEPAPTGKVPFSVRNRERPTPEEVEL